MRFIVLVDTVLQRRSIYTECVFVCDSPARLLINCCDVPDEVLFKFRTLINSTNINGKESSQQHGSQTKVSLHSKVNFIYYFFSLCVFYATLFCFISPFGAVFKLTVVKEKATLYTIRSVGNTHMIYILMHSAVYIHIWSTCFRIAFTPDCKLFPNDACFDSCLRPEIKLKLISGEGKGLFNCRIRGNIDMPRRINRKPF